MTRQTPTEGDGDNPGGALAGQGDAENGKARERRSPEGGLHRQDPQEVADRMKSGGAGMADANGPIGGRTDTPSKRHQGENP